jgi:hypothetical protein
MANTIYTINLTGDCSNTSSGSALINLVGSSPYTIGWENNVLPSSTFSTSSYSVTGLSAGTYGFSITASTFPTNEVIGPIYFNIVSASTAYIETSEFVTCQPDSAYLTVITTGTTNGVIQNPLGTFVGATINLYKDYVYYASATSVNTSYSFLNLSEGMYYAEVTGDGNCPCETESVIIHTNPNTLDFEFYVINNPSCSQQSGKIYVTGITGVSPFIYEWSPTVGGTGDTFVTGLTQGSYNLTVIDANGCSLTKTTTITNAEPISFISYTTTPPTCFNADGSITFNITGGTAPYFYLLSNGDSVTTYGTSVTFNNIGSGSYTLTVTDVSLCSFSTEVDFLVPRSFSLVSETVSNSQCSYNSGSITVTLLGGTPPFIYSLSNNSGVTTTNTSILQTNTFNSLESGTYTLTINDSSSACTYTNNITVLNDTSFNFSITGNSTYCGLNDGSINISVTPSYTSSTFYTYSLSNGASSYPTTSTTYTFTNLPSGDYDVTIQNLSGCTQTTSTTIDYLAPYQFALYGTDCINGSGGTISVLLNESIGPFNFIWSDNVNGQSGTYITGLTAGTYVLTVSGTSNCETTKSIDISCNPLRTASSTYKYTIGDKTYLPSSIFNFTKMLNEGYLSLTTGHEDCKLKYAKFNCDIELAGTVYSGTFFTTTSLSNSPTVTVFKTAIDALINTIPDIKSYEVNLLTNTISIESDVVGGVEVYKDEVLTISVRIDYSISCRT